MMFIVIVDCKVSEEVKDKFLPGSIITKVIPLECARVSETKFGSRLLGMMLAAADYYWHDEDAGIYYMAT